MKALVKDTCVASIPKVCQQQYDFNPPFACVSNSYTGPLTVISLSFSDANLFATIMGLVVASALAWKYKDYSPSESEIILSNPPPDGDDHHDVEMISTKARSTTDGWLGAVWDELARLRTSDHQLRQQLASLQTQRRGPGRAPAPAVIQNRRAVCSATCCHALATVQGLPRLHHVWRPC